VIKIVTREDNKTQVGLMSGERSQYDANVYSAGRFGEQGRVLFAANNHSNQHHQGRVSQTPIRPFEGALPRATSSQSALLEVHYGAGTLTHNQFESEYYGIDGAAAGSNQSRMIYTSALSALNWNDQWGAVHTNLHSEYTHFYLESEIADIARVFGIGAGDGEIRFENDARSNYRWRSGFNAQLPIQEHRLIVGYDYEVRSSNSLKSYAPGLSPGIFTTLFPQRRSYENTAFVQADFNFKQLRIVSGLRYVKELDLKRQWLPRIAALYRQNKQTFRFSYGQGYNSPSFAESGVSITNVIIPTRELKSELVATTELAYRYTDQRLAGGATLYYLETKDFLDAVKNKETTLFINVDRLYRQGLELELEYHFSASVPHDSTPNYKLIANLSYHHQGGGLQSSDPDLALVPRITSAFGLERKQGKHTLGLQGLYYEQREIAPSRLNLDLRYQYNIGPGEIFLQVQNLLDRAIEDSDFRIGTYMEENNARSWLTGIKFTF
jgi:outer membrane cobalamin receptor